MSFDRFDLAGYLRRQVPAARAVGDGQEWLLTCPRCLGAEHLYVSTAKRCAHCFRCDWSPGVIDLLAAIEGRPREEILLRLRVRPGAPTLPALERLRERVLGAGARLPPREAPDLPAIPFPPGYVSLARRHDDATERALAQYRAYLAGRRVPQACITRHRIGCAIVGRYAGRVIFPVLEGERLVGLQARDVTGRSPLKYLGPAQGRLGATLFNLEDARAYPRIVLCEGIISALCTGPDAVASFGKSLKPAQIALLVGASRPVVVLYDAAKPGTGARDAHREAEAAAERLHRAGLPALVARLSVGDPAENPPEVVRQAIAEARPFDPLAGLRRQVAVPSRNDWPARPRAESRQERGASRR